MLSWLHCFSLYAAVITSKYPHKAMELLAYQATVVAEQRRCGGRSWLLYDAGFRQQLSSVGAADFSKMNQSLYTTTFLGEACSAPTVSCPTTGRKTVPCTHNERSRWCGSRRRDRVCGRIGGRKPRNPAEKGHVLPGMMASARSKTAVSSMYARSAPATTGGLSAGLTGVTQTCRDQREALKSSTLGGEQPQQQETDRGIAPPS